MINKYKILCGRSIQWHISKLCSQFLRGDSNIKKYVLNSEKNTNNIINIICFI